MTTPPREMTALERLLLDRIRTTGPLTIADYMTECLLHPTHGYYTTRDPIGAAGDFTTAPEISQMFGEMLGLCLAQAWLDQGAHLRLSASGMGRGQPCGSGHCGPYRQVKVTLESRNADAQQNSG